MRPYLSAEGSLNLASYFPRELVPPDLGPKMYCAMGYCPDSRRFAQTNLHCDISDAFNLLVSTRVAERTARVCARACARRSRVCLAQARVCVCACVRACVCVCACACACACAHAFCTLRSTRCNANVCV